MATIGAFRNHHSSDLWGYNINPERKDSKELLETNQKTVLTGIDSDPFNFQEGKYAIEVIKGAVGVPILAHIVVRFMTLIIRSISRIC